jgi:hypothetical protein
MSYSAVEFIQSNEVWNRNDLTNALEKIVARKGKFVCILGGKDTGKSKVFRSMEIRYPAKVFRLDLRTDPDILSGLVSILRNRQDLVPTDKLKNVLYNVASKWIELNLGLTYMKPDAIIVTIINM